MTPDNKKMAKAIVDASFLAKKQFEILEATARIEVQNSRNIWSNFLVSDTVAANVVLYLIYLAGKSWIEETMKYPFWKMKNGCEKEQDYFSVELKTGIDHIRSTFQNLMETLWECRSPMPAALMKTIRIVHDGRLLCEHRG